MADHFTPPRTDTHTQNPDGLELAEPHLLNTALNYGLSFDVGSNNPMARNYTTIYDRGSTSSSSSINTSTNASISDSTSMYASNVTRHSPGPGFDQGTNHPPARSSLIESTSVNDMPLQEKGKRKRCANSTSRDNFSHLRREAEQIPPGTGRNLSDRQILLLIRIPPQQRHVYATEVYDRRGYHKAAYQYLSRHQVSDDLLQEVFLTRERIPARPSQGRRKSRKARQRVSSNRIPEDAAYRSSMASPNSHSTIIQENQGHDNEGSVMSRPIDSHNLRVRERRWELYEGQQQQIEEDRSAGMAEASNSYTDQRHFDQQNQQWDGIVGNSQDTATSQFPASGVAVDGRGLTAAELNENGPPYTQEQALFLTDAVNRGELEFWDMWFNKPPYVVRE